MEGDDPLPMPSTAEYLTFNNETEQYTTVVQFGNPIQNTTGPTFALDTATSIIMTTTVECGANCTMNTYDMANSSSAVNVTEEVEFSIPLGLSAMGREVQDTVCTLSSFVCFTDMKFFAITNGTSSMANWTFENIFGLGPRSATRGPDYIERLKESG